MINNSYFDKIFLEAVAKVVEFAPKDTGNLAFNSIKYKWVGKSKFVIYVDVGDTDAFVQGQKYDKGVAPYMPFTNEKWISPKWNGKQNPNENWWNNAIVYIINYIAKSLGGKLEW